MVCLDLHNHNPNPNHDSLAETWHINYCAMLRNSHTNSGFSKSFCFELRACM